eukprot:CAMPEP_0198139168 /NCGR_PEP_ID=MMETSP1443-20131203/2506_1 /TAXON_ID=186043 /ORGANISM="Entomoneis sp., Strain CCMP2396" /LENGTH=363 /DNA_ID=CAMNT_0043801217 /DNA_START=102 /DNA_END=1193 /DNA_ORIENTATION=+
MALDFTTSPPGIGNVIPGRMPASSLSFHSSGKRLFVAHEDDSRLQVVDCLTGKADRPALKLERETIRLVHATHHEDCILLTGSGKLPTQPMRQKFAVNYMSVHDNKILRKFRGHTDRVNSLSICPENDSFLSASNDRTVRLWTLQQAGCLAECALPGDSDADSPLTVFDSTGMIFCVTASQRSSNNHLQQQQGGGHYLHMYDARNHGAGAFAELKITQAALSKAIVDASSMMGGPPMPVDQANALAQQPFGNIQFNAAGNQMLVGSTGGVSLLLDGFEGTIQKVLLSSDTSTKAVSCFTGDDKYVLSGNSDGTIDVWQVDTGTIIQRLDTAGIGEGIESVAFNPAYQQFATGCKDVAMWTWGS